MQRMSPRNSTRRPARSLRGHPGGVSAADKRVGDRRDGVQLHRHIGNNVRLRRLYPPQRHSGGAGEWSRT